MSTPSREPLRFLGPVALAIAVVYQAVAVAQPMEFLLQNAFVMDDAFYYFQVAWNYESYGFATFDGIHESSGIQLLWGVMLGGLARLVDDKETYLRAILVLCIVFNVLAGVLLRRLGRQLFNASVGEVTCVLWAAFMLPLMPTMIGMEYTLHICVVAPTIGLLARVWRHPEQASTKQLIALGVLFSLNFWVRLDSAVYSLVFALVLVGGVALRHRSVPWREGFSLIGIPAVGTLLYGVTCYALANTVTPISGSVKRHYAGIHFEGVDWHIQLAAYGIWCVEVVVRPVLDAVASSVTVHAGVTHPAVIVLFGAVAWWTLKTVRGAFAGTDADAESNRFLAATFALTVAHSVIVVIVVGHFAHVTGHYYAWAIVIWFVWLSLMVVRWLARFDPSKRTRVAIGGVLVLALMHGIVLRRHWVHDETELHTRRIPTMEWIDANVPLDARIGAWNAGEFGYFLQQTVINLDGLANDRDFLEHLKSNGETLDYLREKNITYLVDIDDPDLTMPYKADWDRAERYRDLIPREALEVVWSEDRETLVIEVLRVKPEYLALSESDDAE